MVALIVKVKNILAFVVEYFANVLRSISHTFLQSNYVEIGLLMPAFTH